MIGERLATLGDCHFAVEDNVRRLDGMGVLTIIGVRAVLPDVGVTEAFGLEFPLEDSEP